MALPAPNLDDRRFQDLVDEAKRLVQQRCPEWTDHNVSDPGVTLIEAFASMVDQLLYRLNRVPERHYLKFLELIGVRLFPPAAASADVTCWLSAAREDTVVVPAGTQVSTVRTDTEDPVVYTTVRSLPVVPSRLHRVITNAAGGRPLDRTEELAGGTGVDCFQPVPEPDDALLLGLAEPAPSCAVLLRLECAVSGIGIDPTDPPLVWEAWTAAGWAPCEVDRDSTGGLNRSGDVVVHLPASHAASVLSGQRAAWIRCRVVAPARRQPFYQGSPRLTGAVASTIGGTVQAVHAEVVQDEVVGLSEGVPGQRFRLQRAPLTVTDGPLTVEVAGGDGWTLWTEVASFADSGPDDRHLTVDRIAGEIAFGPAVRLPDGELRQYGAVPPKAAPIRVPAYRTGGGRRGNVARDTLVILRDPVPFVSNVSNRRAGSGGMDGETVADASLRGPLQLRTRDRAVTAEDYEQLAREAAPQAVRVKCVPAGEGSPAVRVLVVPSVIEVDGRVRFADLRPSTELLTQIAQFLDERRCVGARVSVEPPFYQGVTVVAQVRPKPRNSPDLVQGRAVVALDKYLNPISGGPDGTGWPFGRPVQAGEIFAVLQRVSGVDIVEEVRLFAADPITGQRGEPTQRVELPPTALAYSYQHQVRVVG